MLDVLSIVLSFVFAYLIRIDRVDDGVYFEMYRNLGIIIVAIYLVLVSSATRTAMFLSDLFSVRYGR